MSNLWQLFIKDINMLRLRLSFHQTHFLLSIAENYT